MTQIFPHLRDVRIDYAWGGTLAITDRPFRRDGRGADPGVPGRHGAAHPDPRARDDVVRDA
jgi:hypothetical protein